MLLMPQRQLLKKEWLLAVDAPYFGFHLKWMLLRINLKMSRKRNKSFEIQVEDTVGDKRPRRGRERPSAVVRLSGGSMGPVIQENLDRPVTAGHLENVLNDFQARMASVMEEQIKSNMLFFQVIPGQDAALPLRGQSQEGRLGTSQHPL
ncbi:hypothetical protein BVRB_6g147680 [Beta vulgaris subsp. vulgaris]|nr:hypothetical protein BVRB_6g147680 [Beta vulgaris subsp. vulgaris]